MRCFLAIAAAVSVVISSALAQAAPDPPIPQEDIIWLLHLEDLRQELKLDAQQREALDAVIATMHVPFVDLDALSPEDRKKKIDELLDKAELTVTVEEALARVFTPEQQARYAQLKLHYRGEGALKLDSVATALALTDQQRRSISEKIQAIRDTVPRRDIQRDIQEREARRDAVWDVLTPEQEAVWEKLAGRRLDFQSSIEQRKRIPLVRHGLLLRNQNVLKELRVSDEQRARIAILLEKMVMETDLQSLPAAARKNGRVNFSPMMRQLNEVTQAALARFLSPEQLARFEQLDLQSRGIRQNLEDKAITERLGLTAEQREKLDQLKGSNPRPGGERARLTDEELKAWRERGSKLTEEMFDVLTPEQKQTWEKLMGPKFGFSRPAELNRRP
jgi:Spy/CpxP family protein refolding chaperone